MQSSGWHRTAEVCEKISKSVKRSWENATQRRLALAVKNKERRGWHHTDEIKTKIAAARRQQWVEHRDRMMHGPKAAMKSANRRPNGIERRAWLILNRYQPGMWIYSGGGPSAKRIGGHYPDFLSELQKKIIEIDGVPWHRDPKRTVTRNSAYRKAGYQVLSFRYDGCNEKLLNGRLRTFCR